jgi:mono/diheme cytochrome c family protein
MRTLAIAALLLAAGSAQAGAVDDLLDRYRADGAAEFSAERGSELWHKPFTPADGGAARNCGSCHGTDLTSTGEHIRTGKLIEPISPSANPQRLSDAAHIEKWFTRNCKWTWGRACTAQEKGDILLYLRQQ